jgi:pimeloyl-[acyl-carrier protein] methyl ester esterase
MDGTAMLFEAFVAEVGMQFKTRCISYPNTTPMGYEQLIEYVRAQLPVNESFVLLGESFSGPIAVALAAEQSTQLKGLILCCTFVRNPRPSLTWLKPMLNVLPMLRPPMRVLSSILFGHFSCPELQAQLVNAIAQVAPLVVRARLRAVLSVDVSQQIAAVKVPTLYLRAVHDRVVPQAASELICSLNARTDMVNIEAPHCLLQAAPYAAVQVIQNWLAIAHE